MENHCLFCGKVIKKGHKFCSNECQVEYNYRSYIKRWKEGKESGVVGEYGLSRHIRRYIFEKYQNKCSRCGWSQINPYTMTLPLEINHIDSDYRNNKEENLELLCPNCHSLEENAKGANKGNGRKARNRYYQNREVDLTVPSNLEFHKCPICGKLTKNKGTCSIECENKRRRQVAAEEWALKQRPSREQLIEDLRSLPMTRIGQKYGVSDKAVVKWCKKFNLPFKYQDIKAFFNK